MANNNHAINESIILVGSNFDIQGHRGCRGLMPENTVASFIKAIDLGVTTIEMDVVITKDNQVILSHEPFFNHEITTKPNGLYVTEAEEKRLNIYSMTYDSICKYDVGLKPHPRFTKQTKVAAVKPLLSVVIDSVEDYIQKNNLKPVQYNIETKCKPSTDDVYHPTPAVFVDLLMDVLQGKKIVSKTIIQSFDVRTLQYLHKQYPTVKTALLTEDFLNRNTAKKIEQLGFKPTIYSPAYQLVNKKMVLYCKQNNIQLIPWTVNDVKQLQKLIDVGVDGVITDYPNLFFKRKLF
jgi:glycerophosphoryl diester phosphodiesterase